jgi:cobalamin biosynthesis protein CobT
MFTAESKSQLAKLLAEENIRVEHRKTTTAYFDLKNRTLVCPIWKDMNGALYDLLMGHEVGHALYTPDEGWHEALKDQKGTFKYFLNVLEDARIEKKMKRKFPGLTLSFNHAYQQLRKENFFGVEGKNVSEYPLIDRLNLLAKGGNLLESRFSPEELPYVTRMEALETWEDVEALAKELYAYEQEKMEEQPDPDLNEMDLDDMVDEGDDSEMGDSLSSMDFEGDDAGEHESDTRKKKQVSSRDEEGFGANETEHEQDEYLNSSGEQEETEEREPRVRTDEYYREQQSRLLSQDSFDIEYVTLPTPNLKQIVVPWTDTLKTLKDFYNNPPKYSGYDASTISIIAESKADLYQKFMDRNRDYIALLAQEFERKKSAEVYKKSKITDTGDLNPSKLYRYKLLDDVIFKKRMKVYKGKSHGIVLLLDKSGSMYGQIKESIEQILILAMFCRKIGVPFVAYGFTSQLNDNQYSKALWNTQPGDLIMSNVSLREIINSEVSAKDFREIMEYQLLLASRYDLGGVPSEEHLQSTPLNEALVVMDQILQTFRQRTRVDLLNLIIVQDGDTDGNTIISRGHRDTDYMRMRGASIHYRYVLRDRDSAMSWMMGCRDVRRDSTAVILKWLRHRTSVSVFGFYVVPMNCVGRAFEHYVDKHGNSADHLSMVELKKKFREDRYLESYNDGYTRFCYILPAKKDAEELDTILKTQDYTKAKLGNAFAQMFRRKTTNRVLATKFIPLIA